MKKILLAASVMVLALSTVWPVLAEAPKVDKLAAAADLAKEAETKLTAIETTLASETSFKEGKGGLQQDAGSLAILAHALANHPESGWKAAADVRDAAIKISLASKEGLTYADAKAALEEAKAAAKATAPKGKSDHEWNKLAKLGAVMVDVNKRNGALRKASRTAPADPDEAARHATALAVLGLVIHADTHEVKNPADKGAWEKFAADMAESAQACAKAIKAKDQAATKAAFDKVNKTCSGCHAKFRSE